MNRKSVAPAAFLAAWGISAALFAADLQKSGSIPVKDMKESQYPAASKVGMKDAVDAALKQQPGKAVSAELDDEDGFLVYEVTVAQADGRKVDVYIDAGNKSVLGVEKDEDLFG